MTKKIVIKLGSSSLTNGTKKLSRPHMVELARQIAVLHQEGAQIIVVSSGAIAAGKESVPQFSNLSSVPSKQMLASIGQVRLMHTWSELFGIFDIAIGQVLLTREDFADETRKKNAQNTFASLVTHRIIPIVNENDTVATDEIKFGDNDNLSALVAALVQANLLILLTDQEGLYTKDPRTHADAQLISQIDTIDDSIVGYAKDTAPGGVGTGGMITKIQAAKYATSFGTPTVIASFKKLDVLIGLFRGQKIGTFFSV